MPHIHMHIHISDTPMLCDAGVGIHTVQHMTLYLQINTNNPCYKQIMRLHSPPHTHIGDMSIVTIWLLLAANFVLHIYLVVPPSDLIGSERGQY